MRLALAAHLALAAAAAILGLLAWRASASAAPGQPSSFARLTGRLGLVLLGQIVAGLWVLGFVPLSRGQRLFGQDGPGTAAFAALLVVLASATRLAWTAHRRPLRRRTAGLLLAHLGAAAALMAAVAAVLRRPIG